MRKNRKKIYLGETDVMLLRRLILALSERFQVVTSRNMLPPDIIRKFEENDAIFIDDFFRNCRVDKHEYEDKVNHMLGKIFQKFSILQEKFDIPIDQKNIREFAGRITERIINHIIVRKCIDNILDRFDIKAYVRSGQRSLYTPFKKRNIPSILLEHFPAGHIPFPSGIKDYYRFHPRFLRFGPTDYWNVDNKLEKEIYEAHRDKVGLKFEVVTNGTPREMIAEKKMSKEEAKRILGLHGGEKSIISIALGYDIGLNLYSFFFLSIDMFRFLENSFRLLRDLNERLPLHIIIKLHPVMRHSFSSIPHERLFIEYLKEMLRRYSLDALITFDNLTEVISASDIIISCGISGICYEGFLIGKPSICMLNRFELLFCDERRIQESNPISKIDFIRYVSSPKELEEALKYYIWECDREKLMRDRQMIIDKYGLREESVKVKVWRVCDWLENLISDLKH